MYREKIYNWGLNLTTNNLWKYKEICIATTLNVSTLWEVSFDARRKWLWNWLLRFSWRNHMNPCRIRFSSHTKLPCSEIRSHTNIGEYMQLLVINVLNSFWCINNQFWLLLRNNFEIQLALTHPKYECFGTEVEL
jgi:hypothetical protein